MHYYLLTNKRESYLDGENFYHYQDGLYDESPTGIYFINEIQLLNWKNHVLIQNPVWIRQVLIPSGEETLHMNRKEESGDITASKVFLCPREAFDAEHVKKYIDFSDKNIILNAVEQDGLNAVQELRISSMSVIKKSLDLRNLKQEEIKRCILSIITSDAISLRLSKCIFDPEPIVSFDYTFSSSESEYVDDSLLKCISDKLTCMYPEARIETTLASAYIIIVFHFPAQTPQ